tara:strand:+ start:772 stop:2229 length:1458 start_codon:yes stop_codon:yes gene_type:complete
VIVGVDLGTSGVKALVVTENLETKGSGQCGYPINFPRSGWAEQNPLDWEKALGPAINQALNDAAITVNDVTAIGVTGQLDGCIPTDKNGCAVGPCLTWADRRAQRELVGIDAEMVQNCSGLILDPGHMAAKIRWLKNNSFNGTVDCYHQPVSYLVSNLTGNKVFDHSLASTTMLYNLRDREYDQHLLNLFGVEEDELPSIDRSYSQAGVLTELGALLTGLNIGTPVSVGTGDDFAALLGAGFYTSGNMVVVSGTAEVVGAIHPTPVIDRSRLLETHIYPSGEYFIENPGWLSGGALIWLSNILNIGGIEEIEELSTNVPPGAEGITFLPALNGAMTPEWNASARGCFFGLGVNHGPEHLARAVLEGTAFAIRDVGTRLKELGVEFHSVLLLGGGARSKEWAHIRADVLGVPVAIPNFVDTTALGAAMTAAVATGLYADLRSCSKMASDNLEISTIEPSFSEEYETAYQSYHKLYDNLKSMFMSKN